MTESQHGCICRDSCGWEIESIAGYIFTPCGVFYFSWHRHRQVVSLLKDTCKLGWTKLHKLLNSNLGASNPSHLNWQFGTLTTKLSTAPHKDLFDLEILHWMQQQCAIMGYFTHYGALLCSCLKDITKFILLIVPLGFDLSSDYIRIMIS